MTKRNMSLAAVALACLPLAALFFVAGCETESVTQTDIQIRPAYSELARGQSVTLSASGWSSYRWSIANPEIGDLSATVGNSVIYTARSGAGTTQVITVAPDTTTVFAGTNSTEKTEAPYSGTARVLHR